MTELPPVAKSFSTFCKKCDCERYHLVIAHKTADSAKVECEVCKRKSTYSTKKKLVSKARVKKTTSLSNWAEVATNLDKEGAEKYMISGSFPEKSTIEHPKFGFGYVMKAVPERIEVVFEEGIKTLIQNR